MNNKKIKGSAYFTLEGGFIFTPYAQVGDNEKNLKLLVNSSYGSLWASKKKISVRLVFNRECLPPCSVWVEELTKLYNTLNLNINDI